MKTVNIIYYYPGEFSKDHNYLGLLKTSILSLLRSRNPATYYTICIHCLPEMAESAKNQLEALSCFNALVKLEAVPLPGSVYPTSWSAAITAKLFCLDRACQDFSKFVYLDADTIIRTDISELFDQDLCGYDLGGVQDYTCARVNKDYPVTYVNGGVLLVDSAKIKEHLPTGFGSLYKEGLHLFDQDAINFCPSLHIRQLPAVFNAQTAWVNANKVNNPDIFNQIKIFHWCGEKDYTGRKDPDLAAMYAIHTQN